MRPAVMRIPASGETDRSEGFRDDRSASSRGGRRGESSNLRETLGGSSKRRRVCTRVKLNLATERPRRLPTVTVTTTVATTRPLAQSQEHTPIARVLFDRRSAYSALVATPSFSFFSIRLPLFTPLLRLTVYRLPEYPSLVTTRHCPPPQVPATAGDRPRVNSKRTWLIRNRDLRRGNSSSRVGIRFSDFLFVLVRERLEDHRSRHYASTFATVVTFVKLTGTSWNFARFHRGDYLAYRASRRFVRARGHKRLERKKALKLWNGFSTFRGLRTPRARFSVVVCLLVRFARKRILNVCH